MYIKLTTFILVKPVILIKFQRMKTKILFSVISVIFFSISLSAQPRRELVKVIVTPNHADWTYEIGERAEFSVTVLKNNVPLEGIEINYVIQPELVEIWDEGTLILKDDAVNIKAKKFKDPGFLRCTATVKVHGKEYSSYATAGFSPDKIEPTTTLPADFEAFWNNGKEDLAKVSMNPVLTLI